MLMPRRYFSKSDFKTLALSFKIWFCFPVPKLAQIIEPFADILCWPTKSVHVLAMILRKHGMITKGGRGTAGAEMVASDATNLLLAVMAGGEAKKAHALVMFVRGARLKERFHGKSRFKKRDKIPLLIDGTEGDLGRTLDALFDALIKKPDLPLNIIRFELEIPPTGAMEANLWMFNDASPGQDAWRFIFGRFVDAHHDAEVGLQFIRRIRGWVIPRLADVIRGDECSEAVETA
jgi:hypothetical protein